MKILFAIQGTGNGHLSRAKAIIPYLLQYGEVDILVSGQQADVPLNYPITFQNKGLSFFFGKKGGINFFRTFKKNSLFTFIKEVYQCPINDYDLIINDFEPITAWACKLRGKKCVALSHQSALFGANVPRPKHKDLVGLIVLKYYAPSHTAYSFHFKSYNAHTFTPVIRNAIRNANVNNLGHYTVYLPAYSDAIIISVLSHFQSTIWDVYSKHAKTSFRNHHIKITPIQQGGFEQSITSCKGVLCGGGFETPAEAMFLKKKLLVIPMKNQYEQHFNAKALRQMGITVLKNFSTKQLKVIQQWLVTEHIVSVNYQDQTKAIVEQIIKENTST